jgi:DNA polymerase-1
MSDTLYLVDTFSLLFQVFYAIRQPMTGTRGQPTNAVFGFTGDIEHLLKEKQPTHLLFAMESPEPGERLKIDETYKANRDEMPNDLRPQVGMILELLAAYRIPVVSYPGWEADDVIATLSRRAVRDGLDVRIVSNDKDARQLICPKCKIYSIRKRQFYEEAELLQDWGIRPDQVIDFQSLVGDSVDNVPGVPGIGPKTATTLLQEYGTLEAVLDNADKVKGKKVSENLKLFRDQAFRCRELVTLRQDLPIELNWEETRLQGPDYEHLVRLFDDYGFRRYSNDAQVKLKESRIRAPEQVERSWEVVNTEALFDQFLKEIRQQERFCMDLETTNVNPIDAEIVGWAFSWQGNKGYYIPVDGPPGSQILDRNKVLTALKPILESTPPAPKGPRTLF